MTVYSTDDHAHMALAIRLAARGRYGVRPNPLVGCVIVADGEIIGRGWHERAGEAHAEIRALDEAGARACGATAYVSLEPCDHRGRTGPCSQALIDAGLARVCAAMRDPSPQVAGRGIERLKTAGIDASAGLLEAEARKLNPGFLSRIERGRPRLTLKIAASLDGATAMSSGESRWITSSQARADVQRLRAASGAILTGAGTVLADDPSLTVRDLEVPGQPLRVVLDSLLCMPADSRMLSEPGQTRIYCVEDGNRGALEAAGATVVAADARSGRVVIDAVLEDLAGLEVNDVLAECGPVLAGSLLESGCVDRLVIYQSPHIMGSETRPMAQTPAWQTLAARAPLEIVDVRRVGPDTRITALPRVLETRSCSPES